MYHIKSDKKIFGGRTMNLLQEKLNDFKNRVEGWTPSNGFQQAPLDFAPDDIIFGRRIALSVQRHDCCANPDRVIRDIRNEAEKDTGFHTWFVQMESERLQTLCEFLIYRKPPR